MIRAIAFTFFLALLLLVQQSFLAGLLPFGVVPDLLLVGLAAWLALDDNRLALAWAAGGGLLLDLFSPDLFGLHALLLLVTVWLLFVLRDRVLSSRNRYAHVGFVLAGSFTAIVMPSLVRLGLHPFLPSVAAPMFGWTEGVFLGVTILLTTATSFLLQPVFRRLHALFLSIEQRRSRLKQAF